MSLLASGRAARRRASVSGFGVRVLPLVVLLLAATEWSAAPALAAAKQTVKQGMVVRNNPFARPLVVAPKVARRASAPAVASSALKLRGVLQAGANSFANVDGTVVGLGEEIAGHKLIAVEDSKAIFIRGGQKLVLELASGASAAVAADEAATPSFTQTGAAKVDAPGVTGLQ